MDNDPRASEIDDAWWTAPRDALSASNRSALAVWQDRLSRHAELMAAGNAVSEAVMDRLDPAELLDAAAFFKWLVDSAPLAGWAGKKEGEWKGARAGDLEFSLQHRSLATDKRGGTFLKVVGSLSDPLSGWKEITVLGARERARGRSIEPVFKPLGDTPLLLIDDMKEEYLAQFDGWAGIAVLETSPGNLQASIMAPHVLQRHETLAVQRALARRCGLPLSGVAPHLHRRIPGSLNNKAALEKPFATRLFREPVAGVMSVVELAKLLAEDAAAAPPTDVLKEVSTGKSKSASLRGFGSTRKAGGDDDSESKYEYKRVMASLDKLMPCDALCVSESDKTVLVAEVLKSAQDRKRQGKPPGDSDHVRYADLTVTRAISEKASRVVERKARLAARGSS